MQTPPLLRIPYWLQGFYVNRGLLISLRQRVIVEATTYLFIIYYFQYIIVQQEKTIAESRIRDADMASEMMAYTKNNPPASGLHWLLAQANQVPQGVLQLLQ